MKIHSTPNACYVLLRNGLTLELTFTPPPPARDWHAAAELQRWSAPQQSSGVWMFREEVLFEVRVGQA